MSVVPTPPSLGAYGGEWKDVAESCKQRVWAWLHQESVGTVKNYASDWYIDAHILNDELDPGVVFWYSYDRDGTLLSSRCHGGWYQGLGRYDPKENNGFGFSISRVDGRWVVEVLDPEVSAK